jgi:hypothetical protein
MGLRTLATRRTSLGMPPLLAIPISAEGLTPIRFWVAAIRLPEAVTGLSLWLPHRYGEQIRQSSGIQRAVLQSWSPGFLQPALLRWRAIWSIQRPNVFPDFVSGHRPLHDTERAWKRHNAMANEGRLRHMSERPKSAPDCAHSASSEGAGQTPVASAPSSS